MRAPKRSSAIKVAVVDQQTETIRALGTPILRVAEGVLCLPILGNVDDARAADMTDALLDSIVAANVRFAIIDLTGVLTLDTHSARHLVQMFHSVSLVGARIIVSGIRPAVALTLTALGTDMGPVKTTLTMQEALESITRS